MKNIGSYLKGRYMYFSCQSHDLVERKLCQMRAKRRRQSAGRGMPMSVEGDISVVRECCTLPEAKTKAKGFSTVVSYLTGFFSFDWLCRRAAAASPPVSSLDVVPQRP